MVNIYKFHYCPSLPIFFRNYLPPPRFEPETLASLAGDVTTVLPSPPEKSRAIQAKFHPVNFVVYQFGLRDIVPSTIRIK